LCSETKPQLLRLILWENMIQFTAIPLMKGVQEHVVSKGGDRLTVDT